MGIKKGITKLKCTKCGIMFNINNSSLHTRRYRKLPEFCSDCMKEYKKSNIKKLYSSLSENTKKELKIKRTSHWSDEKYKHEASLRGISQWNNLSDDEKTRRIGLLSNNWKKWYNDLTEDELLYFNKSKRKWWDTLSEKDQKNIIKNLHNNFMKYWNELSDIDKNKYANNQRLIYNNLSKEKKEILKLKYINWYNTLTNDDMKKLKNEHQNGIDNYWNNLSDEELSNIRKRVSENSSNYWKNLSKEELNKISKNRSISMKKYWDNLSQEEYDLHQLKRITGIMESNKIPQESEIQFQNDLNLLSWSHSYIKYNTQAYNNHENPSFRKLFGYDTSPYHIWDFKVHLKSKDILVDIDGSIHIVPSGKLVVNGFDVGLYRQFKDSQRPYQTDGLDAYIIQLGKDKFINNNTKVLVVRANKPISESNEYIDYKTFLNLIMVLY